MERVVAVHDHERTTMPLQRFAEDARDRIANVDKELAEWIHQALLAADPYSATYKAAQEFGLEHAFPIAVGKAAVPMALAWQKATGRTGLAVVPTGSTVPPELSNWQVIEAEHPLPGPGSHHAGRAALDLCTTGKEIVLLLSGGASSMMESPTIDPQEHADLSRRLHALGLPIATWNAARALLSRIKAGGLAAAAQHAGGQLHTLYVSDVPGDDPQIVGSGPGIPVAPERLEAAIQGLPEDLRSRLLEAGEHRLPPAHSSPVRLLVPRDAPGREARRQIEESGYRANLLDPIDEPVEDAAKRIAATLGQVEGDELLVVWGEPLVHLPDDPGPGGRTTHLLCALWTHPPAHHAVAAFMTTDGTDGASGLGGCYASLGPAKADEARDACIAWRSATFLKSLPRSLGGGVPAHPTGTNCADIGILRPPSTAKHN